MPDLPTLYSFRRCPYAMRARLAILSSGMKVELREVILRDKPDEMIEASPKATVPVLIDNDGAVLEESIDIIDWALTMNDCEGWRSYDQSVLEEMQSLIEENDGPFKTALDRYKYANRHDDVDVETERNNATVFLVKLNEQLAEKSFLFGENFSLADGAILPFVRQFAHVDRDWFWAQDWLNVIDWLDAFLVSDRFASILNKYPQWYNGDQRTVFP